MSDDCRDRAVTGSRRPRRTEKKEVHVHVDVVVQATVEKTVIGTILKALCSVSCSSWCPVFFRCGPLSGAL